MGIADPVKTRNRSKPFHTRNSKDLLPIVAVLAAVILWGGSFAAMRITIQTFNPWLVMWLRMAVAAAVLLPFAGKLMPKYSKRGDWKMLLPMVIFQPCLYFLFESYALTYTTSSQAGIIAATLPIMVLIGARMVFSETLHTGAICGIVLSIACVATLTLLSGAGDVASNPLLGNSLEVLAMMSAAAYMIVVKKMSLRYNPWSLTALQIIGGTLFFSPGIYYLIHIEYSSIQWQTIAAIVYLGAFVTLAAFGLYNWAISKISASRASAFINLVPVIAVCIGWMALDETLNTLQGIAAAGVIIGVWLSQKSPGPQVADSSGC